MKQGARYHKAAAIPTSLELIDGERSDVSWVTTEALDRDGEVLLADGLDTSQFSKNPIVTFSHKYDELPVGKCLWIKKQGSGWKAKTQYASRPDDWDGQWFADAVFALVKQGILKGKSVGFLATSLRPPTKKELSARPELKANHTIIEKSLLLEYAVAPLPANQAAITEAVSKGWPAHLLPEKPLNLTSILSRLDPNKIAEKAFARLKNRGRV